MTKFLRRTWSRYSKLGKGRKKKQKWRRPTGRDNKLRERRKNRGARVEIGYKKGEHKKFFKIENLKDLERIPQGYIVILGKIGKKKKIEIAKKAKEKKIKISNLNIEKFLKKIEEKEKKKKHAEASASDKKTNKRKTDKQSSQDKGLTDKKMSEPSEANGGKK